MVTLICFLLYVNIIIVLPILFLICIINPSKINKFKNNPTRLNVLSYWIILSIINILLISFLTNSMIDDQNDVNINDNKIVKNSKIEKSSINDQPTNLIKWNFQEQIDKMTSNKIKFASIEANELLYFDFPYDGGSIATLTIRKKDGVNNIYLSISKGQFILTNFNNGYLRIKFDNEPPIKYSILMPSDYSSDVIFINSSNTIISKLKKCKKIIIEAEFYDEGNRQMEFDVNGFKW